MADYIVREYIVRETTYPVGGTKQEEIGELVRCRDCKYWDTFPASTAAPAYHECKARASRLGSVHTTADEFCSRGEGKDGEQHDS